MFCPKCKQTFEEGSRRFCPTDGSRLVPENSEGKQWEGGIFADLIARPNPKAEVPVGEAVLDMPEFALTEAEPPKIEQKTDDSGDFFILEDIEPDETVNPILTGPVNFEPHPVNVRPPIKKVDPHKIPLGHVVLDETDRLAVSSADFRADDPEAFIGRTVKGRYVVTSYLGGDEFGYAFLANDRINPDRKVLVRILLRGEADEMLRSTLEEERVSLSHLSHPSIARLIDSGQFTDGTRYLVTEYVDALSTADILKIHGAFDPQRAARVLRQTAYALGEAHQEGILHRDIRPSNIIVAPAGSDAEQVTLVNFGASTGEPTEMTMPYRAPEVLAGRVSTVSSDIYSLGVVAYEMTTGKRPFAGSSTNDLIRSQNDGLGKKASALRRGLSRSVDDVLAKALSFKVADRYVKARDLGDAIYTALMDADAMPMAEATSSEELPVVDTPASPEKEKARPTEPERIVAEKPIEKRLKTFSAEPTVDDTGRPKMVGAVLLLALIGLVAAGWYFMARRPAEPDVAGNVAQNTDAKPAASSNSGTPSKPLDAQQPPNSTVYENNKENLRGDLLSNFVGFKMFYPKDWKVNGPQPNVKTGARGNFIDVSKTTPDGRMQEQMLVSYYPSKGTVELDRDAFPQFVKETNETLKKLLPGYQMVSDGETTVNGRRAYEIRFQGGGTSPSGEKLVVWGRRLLMPAEREGAHDGFMITMLATSLSDQVHSVDDIGVKGDLAGVLKSFEPSQNF